MDGALWLKALHVMAFTAWMAGMWYLPRLMVYHAELPVGSAAAETFKVMERRLLKAITTPAMIVTLLAGVALASVQGQWGEGWLHGKLLLVAHDARPVMAFSLLMFGDLPPTSGRSRRCGTACSTRHRPCCSSASCCLPCLKPF